MATEEVTGPSGGQRQISEYDSYLAEWEAADEEDEGRAWNGRNVGSGYDCITRRSERSGEYVALVTHVPTGRTGMTYGFLEPERGSTVAQELRRLAIAIASAPSDIIWEARPDPKHGHVERCPNCGFVPRPEHTPGPWIIEEGAVFGGPGALTRVCDVSGQVVQPVQPVRRPRESAPLAPLAPDWVRPPPRGGAGPYAPNLRLIAAAPDLLAALRETLRILESQSEAPWVKQARAAIAKAEGRA